MLAETGRRRNTKYVFDLLACVQLAPDDFNLTINAAICGDDEQANSGLQGGILHLTPSARSLGYQPVFPPLGTNFRQFKMYSLSIRMQAACCNQLGRNAQPLKPFEYQGCRSQFPAATS